MRSCNMLILYYFSFLAPTVSLHILQSSVIHEYPAVTATSGLVWIDDDIQKQAAFFSGSKDKFQLDFLIVAPHFQDVAKRHQLGGLSICLSVSLWSVLRDKSSPFPQSF